MFEKNSGTDKHTFFDRTAAFFCMSGIYLGVFLSTLIGRRNTLRIGKSAGSILYVFSRRIRNKILLNLKLAYNNSITSKEKNHLAKRVLQNFGKNWAELFFFAGPLNGTSQPEGTLTIFQFSVKDCGHYLGFVKPGRRYPGDILRQNHQIRRITRQEVTPAMFLARHVSRTGRKMIQGLGGGNSLLGIENIAASRSSPPDSGRDTVNRAQRFDGRIRAEGQGYGSKDRYK